VRHGAEIHLCVSPRWLISNPFYRWGNWAHIVKMKVIIRMG
jgi:hypothetical protein